MIFYTLQGPQHRLEIHDDKIKLIKKPLWRLFKNQNEIEEWSLQELSKFQISVPKVIWGKLEWSTFNGSQSSFHFSTNNLMMIKIEKYVQKLINKNVQRQQNIVEEVKIKKQKKHSTHRGKTA